jgi:hypothetical protein
MIDNTSTPGSWRDELARAPWAYGQSQANKVESALVKLREAGLWDEATVLQQEILTLKREVEWLREKQ